MVWSAGRRWVVVAGALAAAAAAPAIAYGGPAAATPASGASAPAGEGYAIKLTRPLRVGDKYAFTADATVVQTMTANLSGQVRTLKPRSVSVHFEGTEHVLAVSPQGEPTEAAYAVVECTAREGKQQVVVVQPGRVVTVEAGKWKSKMDVDQGGLTIQDEILLRAVLSLPTLDGASDDDCFGTDKRHKVGDTWPVRADALLRAVATATGVKAKKQDAAGTMKLAGVETVEGVPCLRVQGKVRIEHFFPPATDLPEGAKVVGSTFEYKFTRIVPVDPSGPAMTDSHSTNVILKLRTDEAGIGPDVVVDGKVLRTVGVKRRPVRQQVAGDGAAGTPVR